MSDIETSDWSELAANNIQPAPGGWPANSSPMIVYSNGREDMGAIKRDWNRRNPTVTSGGAANVQTLTYTQGPVAYVMGQTFTFIVGFLNSGATTLNVNGLGAKNVFLGGVACTGGELVVGAVVQVVYDGTQFQIIGASAGAASVAGCLKLTGGTLTGGLTMSGTTIQMTGAAGTSRLIQAQTGGVARWNLTIANSAAEGGANAGSDFQIVRCADAGTIIDNPLTITRSTGQATLTGSLALSSTVGANQRIVFGQTSGSNRWSLVLGSATAEGGSNAGSDFQLNRYNDGGTFLAVVMSAVRSTGVCTFTQTIVNSDRRIKSDIEPIKDALAIVEQLQGVYYHHRDIGRRQVGLIAQDVIGPLPEVVFDTEQPLRDDAGKPVEGEATLLGIAYPNMVAVLIEAVKELTAKVARLEAGLTAASQA